jgi:peptidoglycan/LPS O-acetylase OafA/YrhL
VLRTIGAYLLAALLALVSSSSFRQTLSEFRDTEPGSALFGTLHLLIAASGALAAVGLLKRARWAAPALGLWGAAAVGLLAVQPLFGTMAADEQRAIWLGAAAVGAAAIGMAWFARHLHRTKPPTREPSGSATGAQPSPALLPDAMPAAAPIASAPRAHTPHTVGTDAKEDASPDSRGVMDG